MTRTFVLIAALSLAPCALTACSTPGYKKADSAADNMRSADSVADALLASALNAQTYANSFQIGELKATFPRFEKEVDNFQSNLKRLRSSVNDVRSSTNGYIDSLKKTQEAITNADLKAKTEARIANITAQLGEIDGAAATAESLANEVGSELNDLRAFLRADLSERGIKDSAPARKEMDAAIKRLGDGLQQLKRELKDVQAAIASGE
jgi:prefoldin subunit 5